MQAAGASGRNPDRRGNVAPGQSAPNHARDTRRAPTVAGRSFALREIAARGSSFRRSICRPHAGLSRQNAPQVLADLGRREITSVLIEGGGNVLGQAFDARLVDKVQFYLAPLLTGGPVLAVPGKGAGSTADGAALADAIRENRSRSGRHRLSPMGWRNG